MGDNRANCYWEGGKLVVRASAFGGCIGSLVRAGLGVTPEGAPGKLLKAFAEGNRAEPLIVEELTRRNWDMDFTGDNQQEVELECGPVVVRCHPDGVVRDWEGVSPWSDRVMEIKALKPSFDRHFRPYQWQISIEMAATKLPGLWVYGTKGPDGNVDLATLEFVPVDTPPFSLVEIKRRALAIYRAVNEGTIPECDFRQFPCGYWTDPDALCGKRDAVAEVEDLGLPEELIREYVVAKGVKEDADRDFKEIQERIKGVLADRPGSAYKAGELRMVKVKGGGRFSKDLAKKDGVDVAKYEVKGADYWRIDVEK